MDLSRITTLIKTSTSEFDPYPVITIVGHNCAEFDFLLADGEQNEHSKWDES